METLITLASISGIIIVGYFSMMHERIKNFKRFLRVGDPVNFYIGEERHIGVVKEVNGKVVVITYRGKTIYKSINDVYPVFGVRYSSKVRDYD